MPRNSGPSYKTAEGVTVVVIPLTANCNGSCGIPAACQDTVKGTLPEDRADFEKFTADIVTFLTINYIE